MARQVRLEYAGALYHVMARGNRRQPIFWDDEDRQPVRGAARNRRIGAEAICAEVGILRAARRSAKR